MLTFKAAASLLRVVTELVLRPAGLVLFTFWSLNGIVAWIGLRLIRKVSFSLRIL
tara:strand:- start:260 stop:424 length:165 start_codon:yes stop_codon:yes gene_type:complete